MNRCKTCRWHLDQSPRWDAKVKPCTNPKLAEPMDATDMDHDDMLIYSYDEAGTFYTGDNFGCVHHEAGLKSTPSA